MRLVERPLPVRVAGFFTREIREAGKRIGFTIETLDGDKGILARVDRRDGPRVGRYRVNLEDLERIAVPCIERSLETPGLLVIDEIGKMELFSPSFCATVIKALDSPKRIIATIRTGQGRFTDKITDREDTEVILLTEANRDSVLEKLLAFAEGIG
jgi:nucleoside-triphosphatase THEP1